ncbi:MAG: hypothetical protein AAF494_12565 [Pseudomonadota bacterium]
MAARIGFIGAGIAMIGSAPAIAEDFVAPCGGPGDPIPFAPFETTAPHDILLEQKRAQVMEVMGGDVPSMASIGTSICGKIIEDGATKPALPDRPSPPAG